MKVQLTLFGGFGVAATDGSELAISGRKAQALVAFLSQAAALSATREKLADLLWSDRDHDHARSSLRQTLVTLRRDLGAPADLVVAPQDSVGLNRQFMESDVQRFTTLAASPAVTQLQQAADFYGGPFLDGFFAGSAVFDDWAAHERERLTNIAIAVLEKTARVPRRAGFSA